MNEIEMRQTAIEAIYPSIVPKTEVMRTSNLAVCRVNLDSTSCVFQVGDNISDQKQVHVVVCGKKDGKNVNVTLSIDSAGIITCSEFTLPDDLSIEQAFSFESQVLV
jgi:hypothetical protein